MKPIIFNPNRTPILQLTPLDPSWHSRGTYGASGNVLPKRMCYLHPLAALALNKILEYIKIKVSDGFRDPKASRDRRRQFSSRGVRQLAQPPGKSPHNWGFAVDIDVPYCMSENKISKMQLDQIMALCGWICYRTDHELRPECWHYDFQSDALVKDENGITRGRKVFEEIEVLYGDVWFQERESRLTTEEKGFLLGRAGYGIDRTVNKHDLITDKEKEALRKKGIELEHVFSILGPEYIGDTRSDLAFEIIDRIGDSWIAYAARDFQASWDLQVDGAIGPETSRTLLILHYYKEAMQYHFPQGNQ